MIFLIFLAVPIVSADIISINGAGSEQVVIIPNNIIEGFFFGTPSVREPQGGGRSGRILLDHIEIFFNVNWTAGQRQLVSVLTKNNVNSTIDINSLRINIIEGAVFVSNEVTKSGRGNYTKRFIVQEVPEDFVILNITAQHLGKTLNETIKIVLIKEKEIPVKNLLFVIIGLVVLFLMLMFILILGSRRGMFGERMKGVFAFTSDNEESKDS